MSRGFAALLLALVLPAAGQAQEVVELSGPDRPIHLRLETLYSVGAVDGASWEAFSTLDGAAFGPDGRLYLLDASVGRVVAVRSGELDHEVGREGDGPGEYRRPSAVVVLTGGRVAVWDAAKRAFVLFAPDGSPLEQVAPDDSPGVPSAPMQVLAGDAVLALPMHLVSGRRGAIYATGDGFVSATGGLPLLLVPVRPNAESRVLTRVPTLQGGAVNPATRAFEPRPSWGPLSHGRVALVTSERYEIRILGGDGAHRRTLRRPIEPRRTTAADEEAFRRFVRERYERSLRRGGPLRPVEPSGEVNAHPVIPAIQRIVASGTNKIWVQRPDPENPMLPGPIDILDVDGCYIGTVVEPSLGLPDAFGPDGRVVFLTTGEFDVPVARVYRLPEPLR